MPTKTTMIAVSVALAGAAIAATPASATDTPSKAENRLSAAGFIDRPATTPAMQAMLKRLPQRKFVRRTNGDNVSYAYADAKKCGCIYVGSQQAYATYQSNAQARNIVDQNEEAISDYQDVNWDWGPWGGGGFGPWFGWNPGLGW